MKKKSKKGRRKVTKKKISILICLCVLVVLGVFIYKKSSNSKTSAAISLVNDFMSYINEENYEAMYELISTSSKANITKEEFIKRNEDIYGKIEASAVTLSNMSEEEEESTGKIKVTYTNKMETLAGTLTFANTVRVVKETEEYKIIWSSNVMIPGLNNTDTLGIDSVDTKRGSIYDRNGKLLAGEGKVYSIGFVKGNMNSNPTADIAAVSELLGIPIDTINNSINASYVKEDTFVKLKNISQADTKTEEELMRIAGIKIKTSAGRIYPYGEELSHLIGYVREISAEELEQNIGKGYNSSSLIGKLGLEQAFEERLRGLNGYEVYIVDEKGRKKKTIISRDVKDGEDIKLTIDVNIQKYVYQQFKEDETATVVLNPITGEILALCSTPVYDSNDYILGMTQEKWTAITADQRKPLYNRFQNVWAPGSSIKPIIGAIALTNNVITAQEDFGTSGKEWQNNTSWGLYKVTTVKTYSTPANLRNALVYSDNIYFAKLALKIGNDMMLSNLNNIGFNTPMNFPISMNTSKFLSDGANAFESEIQLADTGYGQGKMLVNPLHMAAMYTAFVNDGDMIMPYIEYKQDTTKQEYYIKNAFSKEAANNVKESMIQVIEDEGGTAHNAQIEGLTLAGKTGTAEIKKTQDDIEGSEIGWFCAFTADKTYENQVLIVSLCENVDKKAEKGYVTKRVKNIFKRILK